MIIRPDSFDLLFLAFGEDPKLQAAAERLLLEESPSEAKMADHDAVWGSLFPTGPLYPEGTSDHANDPTSEERSVSDAARPEG